MASTKEPSAAVLPFDARLWALCGVALMDTIGYGLMLPLLPFYAERFGASPTELAVIVAAHPAARILAAPVLGALSDRVGRRLIILAGLLASVLAYGLLSIADTLAALVLFRAVLGAAGATFAVVEAAVVDATGEGQRVRAFGWLGAAMGLGMVGGPALSALLSPHGLAAPALAAAALCALNAVWAGVVLTETRPIARSDAIPSRKEWRRVATSLGQQPLLGLVVLNTAYGMAASALLSIITLFLMQRVALTAQQAGVFWAWAGVVTVLVRGTVAGSLARRFGERATACCGLAALITLSVASPWVRDFPGSLALAAALAGGLGLATPVFSSLIAAAAAERSGC